jgi:hypothetical protein
MSDFIPVYLPILVLFKFAVINLNTNKLDDEKHSRLHRPESRIINDPMLKGPVWGNNVSICEWLLEWCGYASLRADSAMCLSECN